MKKILMATTIVAGSMIALAGANAAVVASGAATGFTATVTIVSPLDLTQSQALNFGKVQLGNNGGDLTVTNAGVASVGGVGGTLTALGGHQAGVFTLTGDATNQVTVTVATGSGPTGVTLSALDAKYGANAAFTTTSAPFLIDGTSTLNVGGTIALTTAAVSGPINYTIAVTYQ